MEIVLEEKAAPPDRESNPESRSWKSQPSGRNVRISIIIDIDGPFCDELILTCSSACLDLEDIFIYPGFVLDFTRGYAVSELTALQANLVSQSHVLRSASDRRAFLLSVNLCLQETFFRAHLEGNLNRPIDKASAEMQAKVVYFVKQLKQVTCSTTASDQTKTRDSSGRVSGKTITTRTTAKEQLLLISVNYDGEQSG
ncbi:hypothetical protein EVAR_100164_1 [Eumeta japonica]|uniref:Uncharacterized protein n=1 Tax=Eumeta variegata TaxID=151549 RepID=A0A4C1ZPX0_EUMVA|nr:hypothetical protein EVAR_100164_1 [Eumeta japonica]